MTEIVYAPNKPEKSIRQGNTVFLAGSIEMGKAEEWQDAVAKRIIEFGNFSHIFNPRRKDWDSSWQQTKENKQFSDQVNWEQFYLLSADVVIVYFIPGTQSPISLLELGEVLARNNQEIIVICPEGFWRKGNVDITCARFGVKVYDSIDDPKIWSKLKNF